MEGHYKQHMETAFRAGKRELRTVAEEAETVLFAAGNALGSGSFYRELAKTCRAGFERAARHAASVYAPLKGRAATGRASEFRVMLDDLIGKTVEIFDANDGTGSRLTKPATEKAALKASLEGLADEIADDLAGGVFHIMPGISKTGNTSITFHGNATNVAIATDGSFVSVEGGQNASLGLSQADLLDALAQVETAIAGSALSASEKDAAGDAVVNARRELNDPAPDASRLRRYLAAAQDFAGKVGASAAGGVLAKGASILLGIEG